jgi:CRP/FNR family cyclic AMP-dependent transcriptional regulator
VNSFTPSDIKDRFPDATERTYGAGQVIIYDGDAPNFVRFIKTGAVKFYDSDENGNEKIMHISGAGSIFPLFYSFEDKKQVDGFYATIAETEVIMVPLKEFRAELKNSPDYAFQTLQWYANEMDHLVLRLKSMEKSSAKNRILQALLYLCDQHATPAKNPKWYRVTFPVTQQTLAELTGLTRETVNINLKDPQYEKLVRNQRRNFDIDREAVADALTS